MSPSFLLVTLLGVAHAAKDPCAAGKITRDPMSGATTTVFENGFPAGFDNTPAQYRLLKTDLVVQGTSAWLDLRVGMFGLSQNPIPAGTAVRMRLANGEFVVLTTAETAQGVMGAGYTTVFTQWTMRASISPADARKAATQGIVAFSVGTPNGEQAWNVNKGGAKRFANGMACAATKG
ncbi:MAG: hypothetical protein H6733_09100 [Alphaproteobacteria bacterium]|nr:hypothetical protein [Alphaproteobacteria bacterium]